MMQNKNETDHSWMTLSIMCSDALGRIQLYDADDRYGLAGDEGVVRKIQQHPPEKPLHLFICFQAVIVSSNQSQKVMVGWDGSPYIVEGSEKKMCHGV